MKNNDTNEVENIPFMSVSDSGEVIYSAKKRKRSSRKSKEKPNEAVEGQIKIGEIVEIPRSTNELIAAAQAKMGAEYRENQAKLKMAREHPYISKGTIMTQAEQTLFKLMTQEFNSKLSCINKSVFIFPMVRLADFIKLDDSLSFNRKAFYNIAYKHIDFLVCDSETLNILFAVELDDTYHNKPDKIARDKFVEETLRDCGIQLFRVKERIKYVTKDTISNMTDFLLELYAPICPLCGAVTILKKSGRYKNYGHRFYGCTMWHTDKDCGYILDID